MDDNRLFLLDAYALIYRAYYALIRSPRITTGGENVSAVFGFCNTLDEVLRKENPTHIAVCFDPRGSDTFRHRIYPEYKAQRQAQPEDITLALPYIKEVISAYNIPVIEVPGYEADDVIGTLSRLAQSAGLTTYMMTPDKDYCQLVTDRVLMYRPSLRGRDFEIRGVKEVCERYGIDSPSQIVDLLALEGDASDNVPGCPGVGEKTAVKLISQYGSVDNIIAHAADIKGALGQRIADNADKIFLSRQLVTIATNVPIDVDLASFERRPVDVKRLGAIYRKLEFRTFLARLGFDGDRSDKSAVPDATFTAEVSPAQPSLFDLPQTEPQTPSTVGTTAVTVVSDAVRIADVVREVVAHGEAGISLYAPGPDAMTARLQGMAISVSDGEAVYISLPDNAVQRAEIMTVLQPMFESGGPLIVSHDVKRDMVLLHREGVDFATRFYDISLAHYLLQPEQNHSFDTIALGCLNITTLGRADTRRSRDPYPSFADSEVPGRMGETASLMMPIRKHLMPLIAEASQTELLNDIEFALVPVLARMELTGVRIDVDELKRMSHQLTRRVREMEAEVYTLAGRDFNIASPKQVGEVLFVDLAIDPKAKRTKNGAFSTTEEILESYRAKHPIVDLILKIRTLNKLLATYINALPSLINPVTGKIHTTFNQTVTATGRISSTNPNLQNIPVRTEDGREIRRAFIADPGCLILSADYSQIELRLMADFSGDPDMLEAFNTGADIHRATAAKIYHLDIDKVDDISRRNAKTANFGIIYGISAFGLSQRLGISRNEAKALIDGYFATYPTIADYIKSAIESARRDGFVTTVANRRRYLPDINSRNAGLRSYAERNAVNAPLQGSAADIIKRAMIAIDKFIIDNAMRSRMIVQVHDELIFNVYPDELPKLQHAVTTLMRDAYAGKVTLEVSAGVAGNWLEAH